ncbi:MAG: hypothetical protein JST80_04660 [Bdellovibrionales bacterium]|nr:hypothetical protein [Bdellovibrionales bacterium]
MTKPLTFGRWLGVVIILFFGALSVFSTAHAQTTYYEPWKGKTVVPPIELGAMGGAAIYGKDVNWSILMTGAYLIDDAGWATDLDDRLWVELQAGPSFFSTSVVNSQTGLQYHIHLRWDFTYNEYWTVYALGGLGGFSLPSGFGNTFTMAPRFGAGVEYQTKAALMFRGEVSADFIGAGIALNF